MRPQNPLDWDKFTWAWVVWIVWFLFWEAWALIERAKYPKEAGETFSEHIWFLRNNGGSFAAFMVAGLVLWLAYHFIVEGRR